MRISSVADTVTLTLAQRALQSQMCSLLPWQFPGKHEELAILLLRPER